MRSRSLPHAPIPLLCVIISALMVISVIVAMAQAIGRTAEAASCGALAGQVSAAFTTRLVSADGTVSGNTRMGYAMQPDYPGWGYLVNKGATTVWERWDGIRQDGSFQDPAMNSFNHYAMGSVGDFLYRTVVGLSSASPGFRSLLVAPKPGGGLTSARSSHRTPYGEALSEWTTAGDRFSLHVVVPTGTSAVVRVPAAGAGAVTAPPGAVPLGHGSGVASFHVPAGDHVFTAPSTT